MISENTKLRTLRCALAAGVIGTLALTPAAHAQFAGTYEGTLVSVDGDFTSTNAARAEVGQAGEQVTIDVFEEASAGFVQTNTFDVVLSGDSFSLDVFGGVVTGSFGAGTLQIVRTIQGTPVLTDTYTLSCISGCQQPDEPEPEDEPEENECDEEPAKVRWIGGAAGSFDDPENWEGEQVPADPEIALFTFDEGGTGLTEYTIEVNENMTKEALAIEDVVVIFESLTQTYSLLGLCGPSVCVDGRTRKTELEVGELMIMSADEVAIDAALGVRASVVVADTGFLDAQLVKLGEIRPGLTGLDVVGGGRFTTTDMSLDSGAVMTVVESPSEFNVRAGGSVRVGNGSKLLADNEGTVRFDGELEIDGTDSTEVEVAGNGTEWLSTATVAIGTNTQGRLEVREDALVDLGQVDLGTAEGSFGDFQVNTGGEVLTTGAVNAGLFGEALITITDGGSMSADALAVGAFAGGEGTVTVREPAAGLNVTNETKIGDAGMGTLLIGDKASFVAQGQLTIGKESTGEGLVNVTDFSTLVAINGATVVGESGTGTLTIAQRARVDSNGVSSIGAVADSVGTVVVEGQDAANRSEWVTSDTLNVGFSGKGDLLIRDSARVTSVDAILGVTELGNGLVDISNGGIWIANDIRVGGEGIGTLMIDATGIVQANVVGISTNANFNGTLIQIGGAAAPQGIGLTPNAKGRQSAQQMDEDEAPAPGLYTQTLMIADGATINAETISLEEGGTLGGTGRFSFDVVNHGLLQPGADECSIGVFTVDGNYTQPSDGAMEVTIDGAQSDAVNVEGDAALGGSLRVALLAGSESPIGRTFDILTANAVSGTFEEIVGDGEFDVEYGPKSVRLTVRSAQESAFVQCSGMDDMTGPQMCGAGACGAGMITVLPVLAMSLIGWKGHRWVRPAAITTTLRP